ncbi:hypothetical protein [Saccharibacillus brassicae]|uniref:Uncharacterized protein n=1 Tax=Saccharibacillus brassicae TaxID=2583377 RepID=A0A4Y6USJ8_SACBS|nr:hypothetical protein [Saccharibacillus brassicae]QDH20024.1 hypothetical protein FFV09_03595 [Saccharibacillus brassicae]
MPRAQTIYHRLFAMKRRASFKKPRLGPDFFPNPCSGAVCGYFHFFADFHPFSLYRFVFCEKQVVIGSFPFFALTPQKCLPHNESEYTAAEKRTWLA